MITYRFRLYPNKTQKEILLKTFDMCRFTYNKLLEELNNTKDRNVIQHKIVELKKEYPELKNAYSKTLQYECYRLYSNLRALSQLKKKGYRVGRLRFKGKDFFKTIHYNQSGYKLIKKKLNLSKIGDITIKQHRKIKGKIKQITIKKMANKWHALIITDEEYRIKSGDKQIGIDLGINNFLVDSEKNTVKNPLFLNQSLKKLKKASKNLSRKKKGSKNRIKAKIRRQKIYEKVSEQKNDFFHKLTTNYINNCSLIGIEKLNIKNMIKKNKYWNKRNMVDSSWRMFITMLKFKAESAGTSIIEVNSKNTSKKCSRCSNIQNMPLNKRMYKCKCGLHIDRDYNAAINIFTKAQVLGSVEKRPLFSEQREQVFSAKQEAMSLTV